MNLATNKRVLRGLRLRGEEGSTLVEFSLSITMLLMVMFGVLDCSRILYFDHYVRYAAEEGARYAMVRGSSWSNTACSTTQSASCTATSTDVTSFVKSIVTFGGSSNVNVSTNWTGKTPTGTTCANSSGNNSPGCVVNVTVTYNFAFILPFLPKGAVNLSSSSAMVVAQ